MLEPDIKKEDKHWIERRCLVCNLNDLCFLWYSRRYMFCCTHKHIKNGSSQSLPPLFLEVLYYVVIVIVGTHSPTALCASSSYCTIQFVTLNGHKLVERHQYDRHCGVALGLDDPSLIQNACIDIIIHLDVITCSSRLNVID